MREISKNLVAFGEFVKDYRLFFISTLIFITFLLECVMVRNFALKQIIWLIIITLVNLYICERKFKANEEPIIYFNKLFFFATWVGMLLFFFWGFLYYYALTFPLLELSAEAQGLVALGLNWRTLVQLAGNLILISLIIALNLEKNIRNLEDDPNEGRFEKKVRIRVQGKMWIFKYQELFVIYTNAGLALGLVLALLRIFNIKIPYVIKYQLHQLGVTMGVFHVIFCVWTILRLLYIILKTIRREDEIAARKKK